MSYHGITKASRDRAARLGEDEIYDELNRVLSVDDEANDDYQFAIEYEIEARERDASDPAMIGERQYLEDGGVPR
jgi:hypothetical protein